MQTTDILLVVIVIAVLAVVGRVIINRQQSGKSISWNRILPLLLAIVAFASLYALTDPYRLQTSRHGIATTDDLRRGQAIGYDWNQTTGLQVFDHIDRQMPMFFALAYADTSHTGYWHRRDNSPSEEVDRTVKVSKNDETQKAIERTTRNFAVSRHPDNTADYVQIYCLTLRSGNQKILCTAPDYDIDGPDGLTKIVSLRPLDPRMKKIVATDSTIITDVYAQAFDYARYSANKYSYILSRATIGVLGAIVAALLSIFMFRTPRQKK